MKKYFIVRWFIDFYGEPDYRIYDDSVDEQCFRSGSSAWEVEPINYSRARRIRKRLSRLGIEAYIVTYNDLWSN